MKKILLAFRNDANFCVMRFLLKDHYDIYRYKKGAPAPRPDLIMADGKTLSEICYDRRYRKSGCLSRPVLLVTTRSGLESVPYTLLNCVDDVVIAPAVNQRLRMSVETLLRAQRRGSDTGENARSGFGSVRAIKNGFITEHLAAVSHAIRAPLSVITSGLDMIDGLISSGTFKISELTRALDVSRQNCRRLTRVIGNLLDIGMLKNGDLRLNPRRIVPRDAIADIIASVRDYFDNKGISLSFCGDSECPPVTADFDMFNRVVLNLLSNAYKSTPRGGAVAIRLSKAPRNKNIVVCVSDNGSGIPFEKQRRLFAPFGTADDTLSLFSEGCGLGLALAKSFVEIHGGRIWFENREGAGSSFCFELPAGASVDAAPVTYGPDLAERAAYEFSGLC